MINLALLFAGYLLGLFSVGVFKMLLIAHRSPPPTKHRRQWRDRPERREEVTDQAPPEPMYMYGVTGLEE